MPFRIDTDPRLTARWGTTNETQAGVVDTPAGPFQYLAVPVQTDTGPTTVLLVGMFRDIVAAEVDQTVRVTAWVALASLVAGLGPGRTRRQRGEVHAGRHDHRDRLPS